MKKIVMTAVFAALAMGAGAQSINVSSAHEAMKRGYLNKAKKYIDAACEHESTKDDANTWRYRALIYSQIGGDQMSKKPKYKDLAPDWAEQSYNAALECKRLDANKEYVGEMRNVFAYVGNHYYMNAEKAYREKNYTEAMENADRSVVCYSNANDKDKFAVNSMYIAGLSAVAMRDTANIKKYFTNMVKKKTDIDYVYVTLFGLGVAENDNAQAMKVATSYVKNCKTNYHAYLLRATGYLVEKNVEKGKEDINTALELTKDSVNIYPEVLVQAGDLLSEYAGEYEVAEARYRESLALQPDQFKANFGMGKMYFNRAADKTNAANAVDPFDEEKAGLYDKLNEEAKGLYGQAISYLEKAVSYIDGIANDEVRASQKNNLINVLVALGTAYAHVDRLDESQAAKNRVDQLMK